MRREKFTQKTSEVLEEAARLAESMGQQAVLLPHLVLGLLGQVGGVVPPLMERIGVDRGGLEEGLRALAGKGARVSGGESYLGSALVEKESKCD